MLASGRRHLAGSDWAFEPKFDGWRAILHTTPSGVTLYSRPGRDMTAAVPALRALGEVVPEGTVLDGELVAGTGGAASFYKLASLLGTRPEHRQTAVSFVAFDVLAIGGRRLITLAYQQRRRRLEDLDLAGPAWCTTPSWEDASIDDLLMTCECLDVEGLVAKRLGSPYRPGQRSVDWVKIKTQNWRSVHGPHRHKVVVR